MARLLYHLPDILAADPAEPIYLVQGERKADKLASWELLATAIAFGARGWREDYATALAGRRVVILPDNDEEGRGFAERVAKGITAAGGRAVIVDLPGLGPKGDVIDWTGSAPELVALAQAALAPPQQMLPLIDPSAWQGQETPHRRWALQDWIPADQATYLTGLGSVGKSLASQNLCTCIALGLPFMGVETAPAAALCITCEDDPDELHRRQKAICAGLGVSLPALKGKLHLVSLVGSIGTGAFGREDRVRPFVSLGARYQASGRRPVTIGRLDGADIGVAGEGAARAPVVATATVGAEATVATRLTLFGTATGETGDAERRGNARIGARMAF